MSDARPRLRSAIPPAGSTPAGSTRAVARGERPQWILLGAVVTATALLVGLLAPDSSIGTALRAAAGGSQPDSTVPGGGTAQAPSGEPSDWPSAATTGVPPGTVLTPSGGMRIQRAGTVIDGLDVRGDISVEADNVVIRNTRIVNHGEWGIILRGPGTNLLVENVTIHGDGTNQLGKGIYNIGGMLTVRRSDISAITDAIMTNHGLIEDNYLHDPVYFPGDHTDMIQSGDGPDPGLSLVIRHNTIINTSDQTSAVALFQDFGVQHDVLIENNYLAGGGYSLYGGDGTKGTPTNIRIINNVWSREVFPDGGAFGPVAYWDGSGSGNVWSGNVWTDGAAVDG